MEPIDSDGVPYHYYNLDPDPQLPPPYNPPAQPNRLKDPEYRAAYMVAALARAVELLTGADLRDDDR